MQTEKNTENFGKGDIRGVIAPESANNAKEGGDLIPTLLFGIPGSSSMALILIGMIGVGIQPGTAILTHQAPYMYGIVWTLVIANTMATILAMAFTKQFCKACLVPYYYMIPSVFLFCAIGAFAQRTGHQRPDRAGVLVDRRHRDAPLWLAASAAADRRRARGRRCSNICGCRSTATAWSG